ncbi:calmodulin-binding transcription activator 1-like, partial [Notechis scutatus]|uniref:Calmodulin-binding transcription activator 1-like n=1 Tax=Notechis scutatus TaxID=8663 RepID=A0A6J1WCE5_9SAUR
MGAGPYQTCKLSQDPSSQAGNACCITLTHPCPLPAGSPGHVPHKCNSIKHRIISPKLDVRPCPFPALTEVQNISGSHEGRAEAEAAKGPLVDTKGAKPAKTGSPTMADAVPDSMQQPSPALTRPGSFPKQERPPSTLSVGAIFVVAGPSGAEKPLALTPSQHLVSGEGGAAPTAPLGLSVLPGLVLSQSLDSAMETNEGAPDAFDPDRFLNSPKQGQTYGGGRESQAEPESPEKTPAAGYSLYVSANRFFIQDDGAPLSASPTLAAAEATSCAEAPMETAGEGGSRAGGLPGGEEEAGGVPEISPKELQEELYSVIQRVAAAAASGGGPFGLSLDGHFPDLISELMTEGTAAEGAGSPDGPSPGAESPEPVLPDPCYTAEAILAGSAQPLVSITDFSPEWSYPEGGVKVLITGPWMDDSESYSCLFDQISVPASLIQSGVLRCYCP